MCVLVTIVLQNLVCKDLKICYAMRSFHSYYPQHTQLSSALIAVNVSISAQRTILNYPTYLTAASWTGCSSITTHTLSAAITSESAGMAPKNWCCTLENSYSQGRSWMASLGY